MNEIYVAFMDNETIKKHCTDQIKFYEFPETGDKEKPFIIINPSSPVKPSAYGSNKTIANKYSYQITIEAKNRLLRDQLSFEIEKEMKALGFKRDSGGLDAFFNETKRYVETKFYSAIFYV